MTPIGNEYVILKPNFNNALQLSRMTYVCIKLGGLVYVQYSIMMKLLEELSTFIAMFFSR